MNKPYNSPVKWISNPGRLYFMHSLVGTLFFLLICPSCQKNNLSTADLIQISVPTDARTINKKVNYSEYFRYNKVIALETTSDSYIGKIDKILLLNKRLYILDKLISRSIYAFDISGSYIFKIHNIGRGPEEFIKIYDFDIHLNNLYLLVGYPYRIIQYSIDGNYIKEIPVGFFATNINVINANSFLVYTCNQQNQTSQGSVDHTNIILDSLGKIQSKMLRTGVSNHGITSCYLPEYFGYAKSRNIILFSPPFSDTVYSYHKNILHPEYFMDFQKQKIPENFSIKNYDPADLFERILKSKYCHSISRIIDTDRILLFEFILNQIPAFCIYEKKSGKTIVTKIFEDDILHIYPEIISSAGNLLIGVKDSPDFLNQMAKVKDDMQNERKLEFLQNLSSGLDPSSNPIIILLEIE